MSDKIKTAFAEWRRSQFGKPASEMSTPEMVFVAGWDACSRHEGEQRAVPTSRPAYDVQRAAAEYVGGLSSDRSLGWSDLFDAFAAGAAYHRDHTPGGKGTPEFDAGYVAGLRDGRAEDPRAAEVAAAKETLRKQVADEQHMAKVLESREPYAPDGRARELQTLWMPDPTAELYKTTISQQIKEIEDLRGQKKELELRLIRMTKIATGAA